MIAGGCALNCAANGKVLKKTNFKKLFVPPVPDDSGAGTGAALFVNSFLNKSYKIDFKNNYLGPSFSDEQILEILKKLN